VWVCRVPARFDQRLAAWGVTGERVHTEIFGPTPSITPGLVEDAPSLPPHLPAGSPGTGPLVSFSRSGLSVHWDPTLQSLLELAEACDVPVRWACRTGVCHTCESGLIAGSVRYQPELLERPAEGNLLICCSQPQVRSYSLVTQKSRTSKRTLPYFLWEPGSWNNLMRRDGTLG
jgi:ferredoxin